MGSHETSPANIPGTEPFGGKVIGEPTPLSREEHLDRWRKAKEKIVQYGEGENIDSATGQTYRHGGGARLVILGEDVMDTCESPWADATVDLAFSRLRKRSDIEVLERGFGMGLVATEVIRNLVGKGGNYTCIELNEEVAEYADSKWKKEQENLHRKLRQSTLGGKSRQPAEVGVEIIRGDAFEQTQELAEKGKKFDIIISDTYPLYDKEQGFNDILDLEMVLRCLEPDGIFAFFGYHPGSEGGLNDAQRSWVGRFFKETYITDVKVYPPRSYSYLNNEGGAVTQLPVIICSEPKLPQS